MMSDDTEAMATQFYSATAIYCLTPSTEELCRQFSDQYEETEDERKQMTGQCAKCDQPLDDCMCPHRL